MIKQNLFYKLLIILLLTIFIKSAPVNIETIYQVIIKDKAKLTVEEIAITIAISTMSKLQEFYPELILTDEHKDILIRKIDNMGNTFTGILKKNKKSKLFYLFLNSKKLSYTVGTQASLHLTLDIIKVSKDNYNPKNFTVSEARLNIRDEYPTLTLELAVVKNERYIEEEKKKKDRADRENRLKLENHFEIKKELSLVNKLKLDYIKIEEDIKMYKRLLELADSIEYISSLKKLLREVEVLKDESYNHLLLLNRLQSNRKIRANIELLSSINTQYQFLNRTINEMLKKIEEIKLIISSSEDDGISLSIPSTLHKEEGAESKEFQSKYKQHKKDDLSSELSLKIIRSNILKKLEKFILFLILEDEKKKITIQELESKIKFMIEKLMSNDIYLRELKLNILSLKSELEYEMDINHRYSLLTELLEVIENIDLELLEYLKYIEEEKKEVDSLKPHEFKVLEVKSEMEAKVLSVTKIKEYFEEKDTYLREVILLKDKILNQIKEIEKTMNGLKESSPPLTPSSKLKDALNKITGNVY